jgi:hypothetical protein
LRLCPGRALSLWPNLPERTLAAAPVARLTSDAYFSPSQPLLFIVRTYYGSNRGFCQVSVCLFRIHRHLRSDEILPLVRSQSQTNLGAVLEKLNKTSIFSSLSLTNLIWGGIIFPKRYRKINDPNNFFRKGYSDE